MNDDCDGRSIAANVALLWASGVVVFAVVGPAAWSLEGVLGVFSATAAAVACLAGATIALLAGHFLRGPELALYNMLVGMTARMAIPLALALGYAISVPSPERTGMLYYLAVFYMASLAVETVLTLPVRRAKKIEAVRESHHKEI